MRIFAKYGGQETACVKQFQSWPEDIRAQLARDASLLDDETPFLAFYESASKWTVLTFRRIVWRSNGRVQDLLVADLHCLRIPDDDFAKLRASLRVSTDACVDAKMQLQALTFTTKDATETVVEFEPGGQLFGFWNVVNLLIKQYSR
jgi:hypothetical protein